MKTATKTPMKTAHLTSYGLPEVVVRMWRERLGEELLPLQEEAVIRYRLLEGENLLISAPTSAGKTFCGELAALGAIGRRRKAVFLVPLKSIAEERYHDFRQRYAPLGIKVIISTADHRDSDGDLIRGQFDLAIVIHEKFNRLLVRNIDLLRTVDLLVLDEVQMLGDRERGATLERALVKVLTAWHKRSTDSRDAGQVSQRAGSGQLLALSATVSNAPEIACWLGCRLLQHTERPVELRQGVLCNGRFRYRSGASQAEGEEDWGFGDGLELEELLPLTIERLVAQGEQMLVFLKSRRACEQLALQLAERNCASPAESTLAQLEEEPETRLSRPLQTALSAGVAFHHADLSYRQRAVLEGGFRSGEIRVIAATTTLALGVNLPAGAVIVDCYKYETGLATGRAIIVPLSWPEYEAMSGRAGRYGQGREYGRSIILAATPLEAETLWGLYVKGEPETLESQLDADDLADFVLDLVTARAVSSTEELGAALDASLWATQLIGTKCDVRRLQLEQVVDRLAGRKLLFRQESRLIASPLGATITEHGLSAASADAIVAYAAEYQGSDSLSWLYFALSLPEFVHFPIYLDYKEAASDSHRLRLLDYLRQQNGGNGRANPVTAAAETLRQFGSSGYILTDAESARLKAALLLLEWIREKGTAEIEAEFKTNLGSILHLTETTSWLLEGIAAALAVLHSGAPLAAQLRRLAAAVRLGYDLPDSVYAQAGLGAEERDIVHKLHRAGFCSAQDFAAADREEIVRIAGEIRAERVRAAVTLILEKENITNSRKETYMPQLKVPSKVHGERVQVLYDVSEAAPPRQIDLTPKSFNYLYKLTAARFLTTEGWVSKEEIEPGFNQAKNMYRVRQELKQYSSGLEELIENNRAGYYRLNLKPEQIKIDFDAMQSFSDLELVELTKRVQGILVS